MKITRTMNLQTLVEMMGDSATDAQAESLRTLLVESGVRDTDEIEEPDWNRLLDRACGSAPVVLYVPDRSPTGHATAIPIYHQAGVWVRLNPEGKGMIPAAAGPRYETKEEAIEAARERWTCDDPGSLAARALGRRGGSAGTPAQLAQRRAAAGRGGRPVVLGTISTAAGTGTVRYAPGRGRVEVVLPDGTVEVPEEASVSSREEALRAAEAWYRDRTWEWTPAR